MSIEDKIDEAYQREGRDQRRKYIGASSVGGDCLAEQSFAFRGFPETPPSAKLKRIFKMGHVIEDIVVADLKKAEIDVFEVDGLTGRQFEYRSHGDHVQAHADGQMQYDGELRLLEIKSMNDRKWKECKKKGVRSSHPRYQSQMQMMMAMSGIGSCVFVAYNKNTSEYLSEIVTYDEFEASAILDKIERVMRGDAPKITDNIDDWRCRGCFQRGSCWLGERPKVSTCRSCLSGTAKEMGGWYCNRHEQDVEDDHVCDDFEFWEPRDG